MRTVIKCICNLLGWFGIINCGFCFVFALIKGSTTGLVAALISGSVGGILLVVNKSLGDDEE